MWYYCRLSALCDAPWALFVFWRKLNNIVVSSAHIHSEELVSHACVVTTKAERRRKGTASRFMSRDK